ncbi:MAG: hypothetical protein WCG73_02855, partial [Candidatus Moraniibacteriota bacterium]
NMQIYFRTISGTKKRKWGIEPMSSVSHSNSGKLAGSVHILILSVLMVIFVIGGGYLYSVNRSAVQGYHLRTLEKEIGNLKQENAELKITEVDLRSLYRIEAAEEGLRMQKVEGAVYLEERGPVALK